MKEDNDIFKKFVYVSVKNFPKSVTCIFNSVVCNSSLWKVVCSDFF